MFGRLPGRGSWVAYGRLIASPTTIGQKLDGMRLPAMSLRRVRVNKIIRSQL